MRKARLGLDVLEAREVPATFYWHGQYGADAGNPLNWHAQGDLGQPPPPPGALPSGGDVVLFGAVLLPPGGEDGGPPPPAHCTGFRSADGGAFAAVYLYSGYTGTVSFADAIGTGLFSMANGAVAQPSASHDLTVTQAFTWTGGTLNSALTGANVFLAGAVGTINPGAGNSITSGSTLVLNPRNGIGASLTLLPGEMALAAGAGIEVNALCQLDVKPLPDAIVITKGVNQTKAVALAVDSRLLVTREEGDDVAQWDANNLRLVNNGGHAKFHPRTLTNFGPLTVMAQPDAFIQQLSGTLEVYAGASISAQPGRKGFIQLSGGNILINDASTGAVQAPGQLIGDLTFSGGSIGFTGRYALLKLVGDVKWTGGVYSPRLDVTSDGACDVWEITGKLVFPNAAALQAIQVQPSTVGYVPGTGIDVTFRWQVLKFDSVELPPNANPPTLGTVPGNAEMQWFTDTVNGKIVWKLRAKVAG